MPDPAACGKAGLGAARARSRSHHARAVANEGTYAPAQKPWTLRDISAGKEE